MIAHCDAMPRLAGCDGNGRVGVASDGLGLAQPSRHLFDQLGAILTQTLETRRCRPQAPRLAPAIQQF